MQIQTEQPKNGVDEHILVCLSSSPSNARIIHTAAKMAKVLHAKFTAIYVQTDSVESEKNRLRLEQNIQLAQGLGAEIVMTHGEDAFHSFFILSLNFFISRYPATGHLRNRKCPVVVLIKLMYQTYFCASICF